MSIGSIGAAGGAPLTSPGLAPADASFTVHLQRAASTTAADAPPETLQAAVAPLVRALESVNAEATGLSAAAASTQAAGVAVSPGDLIMLSMRCNEFMFHCELTANIANRGSDGVQQLFHEES